MKTTNSRITLAILSVLAMFSLAACSSVAAPPDQIGIVRGDGQAGNDRKIHDLLYPGEVLRDTSDVIVTFVPAGSRNYVIHPDKSVNPDRTTPAEGRTKNGTPVNVYLKAKWTLNQDRGVFTNSFVPLCGKYKCDQGDRLEGRAATTGWVHMLDSEFGTAMDAAVRNVTPKFDDTLWSEQAGWDEYAAAVAEEFPGRLRANTGYTDDLFCGSGDTSFWQGEPGAEGSTFTCGQVLFEVVLIEAKNQRQQQASSEANAAQQQLETNQRLREAAEAKYGQKAGEFLGQLDLIEACNNAGATCTIVIGGDGGSISIPNPAPATTPAPDTTEEAPAAPATD